MRLSLWVALLPSYGLAFVLQREGRIAVYDSSTRLQATDSEILEAYRRRRGFLGETKVQPESSTSFPDYVSTGTVESSPVVESTPVVVDTTPPPVVEATPPVVVDTPPPVIDTPPPPVTTTVSPPTPIEPGNDPISQLWRQITSPFQNVKVDVPKIPKDAKLVPDVQNVKLDVKLPELKNVAVPKLPEVKIPDVKDIKIPDVKDIKIPDVKDIKLDTVKDSVKDIKLEEISGSVRDATGKLSGKLSDRIATSLSEVASRPAGQGVRIPGSEEKLPTLMDFFKHSPTSQPMQNPLEVMKQNYESFLSWKEKLATSNVLQHVFDSLRVAEFGVWYVAGGFLLLWQFQSQNQKAVNSKKKEKDTAKPAEAVLDDQSKMHALELEKETMQKELDYYRQQTEDLKRQLKAIQDEVNGAKEPAPKKAPAKKRKKKEPDEDKRILDVVKESKEAPAKKKTAPAKKKAPAKRAVPRKMAAPKKEVVAAAAIEVEKPLNETAFFVEVESVPAPAPAKRKTRTIRKKKDSENPWGSLSQSTLKRKTIKQLSEYLSERGVPVTNDEGKPFKKSDLVEAVQSL